MTGENEKEFEKWYVNDYKQNYKENQYHILLEAFKDLAFEMQIGVYLAYYDSLEIYVDVISYNNQYYWMPIVKYILDSEHKTRNEAYKEAFKKADELRNKQLTKN